MVVTNGIKVARHVKLSMEMDHKHTYTVCEKYFLKINSYEYGDNVKF